MRPQGRGAGCTGEGALSKLVSMSSRCDAATVTSRLRVPVMGGGVGAATWWMVSQENVRERTAGYVPPVVPS